MTENRFTVALGTDPRAESRPAEPRRQKETLAQAAILAATLCLSAAAWVVSSRQLDGMDMGVGTELGSFRSFTVTWAVMMTAMMLPGLAPQLPRRVRADGGVRRLPMFVVSYFGVWALLGPAVYVVYRPHSTVAAGVLVIVAGGYELTPIKRHFRDRCHDRSRSGLDFALSCVGSSAGLMVVMAALGIMSVAWMTVVAAVVLAQKLWAARTAVDLPIAVALLGLGVLILIAPSAVPGLTPPM